MSELERLILQALIGLALGWVLSGSIMRICRNKVARNIVKDAIESYPTPEETKAFLVYYIRESIKDGTNKKLILRVIHYASKAGVV